MNGQWGDDPGALREAFIANCSMCDLNGYRPNGYICDHVDHRPAYERGMALVREELAKARANSVRPTMMARREAYEIQQAAQRQRQSGPPMQLPMEADPNVT